MDIDDEKPALHSIDVDSHERITDVTAKLPELIELQLELIVDESSSVRYSAFLNLRYLTRPEEEDMVLKRLMQIRKDIDKRRKETFNLFGMPLFRKHRAYPLGEIYDSVAESITDILRKQRDREGSKCNAKI